MPKNAKFVFHGFYDKLRDRGYVIAPGKLAITETFQVGCIGRLGAEHMRGFLAAVAEVLAELGIKSLKAAA
jgi:2-aminoethylphosphonate-pyruvate transaminase